MSVLQQMKDMLSPLGVYSLNENSLVMCELKVYASQLEKLHEKLSTLLRECFITTAQVFGLERVEELFEQLRPDLTIQERREKLSKYMALRNTDFSFEDITTQLKLSGISDAFNVDIPNESLTFPALIALDNITEKARRINIIKDIVPAHLGIEAGIKAMCWDDFEKLNFNFGTLDKMSLRFDAFDE